MNSFELRYLGEAIELACFKRGYQGQYTLDDVDVSDDGVLFLAITVTGSKPGSRPYREYHKKFTNRPLVDMVGDCLFDFDKYCRSYQGWRLASHGRWEKVK